MHSRLRVAIVAFAWILIPAGAAAQSALSRGAARTAAEKRNARFDDTFKKYSKRYFGIGWDWHHFKAQALAESQLDPTAESPVGARGLMQLMPSTFNAIATKRPELTSIDDPEWNIAAGIMHNRHLWRLWSKEISEEKRLAFMFGSYNAGEGTIGRAAAKARAEQLDHTSWENIEKIAPGVPRWRYRETLGYVKKIDVNYKQLTKGK